MSSNDFTTKELTKEKSLWDIYLSSRCIKTSKFNTITTLAVFFLLIINGWLTPQPIEETLEVIRSFSNTGLTITLSTLGFLIAGFTIFVTISKPELSLKMAEIKHPDYNFSWLKHNYFIFLRVFIYYLIFAVFCLFVEIFGHKNGIISLLVSYSPYSDHIKFGVVKASYVLLFTGLYFLLMQLKSFIFNIYHIVMTALRWMAENEKTKNTT